MYPKCVHCNDMIDPDSPFSHDGGIRQINPITLRVAWQHCFCLDVNEEDCFSKRSTNIIFQNRYWQYIGALQGE